MKMGVMIKCAIAILIIGTILEVVWFMATFGSNVSNMTNKDMWTMLFAFMFIVFIVCIFLYFGYKKEDCEVNITVDEYYPRKPHYNRYKYPKNYNNKINNNKNVDVENLDMGNDDFEKENIEN